MINTQPSDIVPGTRQALTGDLDTRPTDPKVLHKKAADLLDLEDDTPKECPIRKAGDDTVCEACQ